MSDAEKLRDQMLASMSDGYQKSPGYPTWDLLNAIAITAAELVDAQNGAENKLDVDKLAGDDLSRFVYQRQGIARKPATYAAGMLTVIGSGEIAAGTLFESKGGIQFQAAETVRITEMGSVRIVAVSPGPSGVVGAGAITEIPVTIPGITGVTNEQATADGFDAEDDAALKERFYEALRRPPTSGNIYHYQAWAKEVPGIGGAKVFPLAQGENTVDVVVIDADKLPASDALVEAVQAHIDPGSAGKGEGEAPIGAHCYVSAATDLPVDVSAAITLLHGWTLEAAKESISESVTSYLREIAFAQDYVSAGKVAAAINEAAGVLDYTEFALQGGTGNVSIGPREVATLGEVTVSVR